MLQLVSKSGKFRGLAWPITHQPLLIGRDRSCAIHLAEPVVSRFHCRFYVDDGHVYLEDLNSRNATLVNGNPVAKHALKVGDEIAVGSSVFLAVRVQRDTDPRTPRNDGLDETSSLAVDIPVYLRDSGDSLLQRGAPRTTEEMATLFSFCRELSQSNSTAGLITALLHHLSDRFQSSALWILLMEDDVEQPLIFPAVEADHLRSNRTLYDLICKTIQEKHSLLLPQQCKVERGHGLQTSIVSPIVLGQDVIGVLVAQAQSPARIYETSDLESLIAHAYAVAPYIRAVERLEKLALENRKLAAGGMRDGMLVGSGPALAALRSQSRDAARSLLSVLILGETGSGKELVARMIHEYSDLSDKPLVVVNCAAIPDELFESEVFGYERGAFTGADKSKPGLLEESNGATLFLDEIGDLSLANQARILRAIETGTYRRLGGTRSLDARVRVIAATNKNLEEEVAHGHFRRDLYHRLNAFTVTIPPLRDRRTDIPELVEYFRNGAVIRRGTGPSAFTPEALRALERHNWPGNVRELRNVVERAVSVARNDCVTVSDLGLSEAVVSQEPFLPLEELERKHILEALRRADNNVRDAAELLNIGRSTLYRKLADYDIPA